MSRAVMLTVIVSLCVLGLVSEAPSSAATQVLFAAGDGSPRPLHRVPLAGGRAEPVGDLSGSGLAAESTGRLVAFVGKGPKESDVFVMAAEGATAKNVSNLNADCDSPVWSRDGRKLAFSAKVEKGSKDIYVVSSDGTGLLNATNSATEEKDPQWGAESRWLAFTVQPATGEGSHLAVWQEGPGVKVVWDKGKVGAFAASPAEDKVAVLAGPDKAKRLHLVEVGTGAEVEVNLGGLNVTGVRFSPDGTRILLSGDGISVVGSDGKGLQKIVREALSATWSPDGKRIAYLVSESVRDDKRGEPGQKTLVLHQWLWAAEATGRNAHRLWGERGEISIVGWAPDASEVVFTLGEPSMSLSIPESARSLDDNTRVTLRFQLTSQTPVRLIAAGYDSGKGRTLAAMSGIGDGCVVPSQSGAEPGRG